MKEKFSAFVGNYIAPWKEGATGVPWSLQTSTLIEFGNSNLPPDLVKTIQVVMGETGPEDKEVIEKVWLTAEDVEEAMEEMGYVKAALVDPQFGLSCTWEVELLSNVIA